MKRAAIWFLPLLAGFALAAPATYAQGAALAEDEALWKRLDITEDGWLDGKELDGGWKRFDASGDGEVTRAEFFAGRARERGGPAPKPIARPTGQPKPAPVGKIQQPPAARMVNGRPVGLYFMTRFWAFTGSLEMVVWYFAPDGRAYQGLQTGFSAADLAAHKGYQGTYQVAGDTMQITWSEGKPTKSTIERSAGGFAWDAAIFTAVKPFQGAKSIAGSYEGGESLSVAGNSAAVSKTLQLRADGTFTWDGVASVTSATKESKVTTGGQSSGGGTWRMDGYSLLLTERGGRVIRGISFPYDDPMTPVYPDRLFFNGTMYKRR